MSDSVPDWGNFPSLDGIGEKADVKKKGNADYANWAKVCRYMRQHAQGWQPAFKTWVDSDGHEHRAFPEPDGTASVIVFWRSPEGSGFLNTEDYCQPILLQNKPKKLSECSSLIITNAIKRGWAAAAATHFGLFAELWSKDPMECPFENEDLIEAAEKEALKAKAKKPSAVKKDISPTQASETAKPVVDPLADGRANCSAALRAIYLGEGGQQADPSVAEKWITAVKEQFSNEITADKPTIDSLTTEAQIAWCTEWITNYTPVAA